MKRFGYNWLLVICCCLGFWFLVGFGIYKGINQVFQDPKETEKVGLDTKPIIDSTYIISYLWLVYMGDTLGNIELPKENIYLDDSLEISENNYYLQVDSGSVFKIRLVREKNGDQGVYIYTIPYEEDI